MTYGSFTELEVYKKCRAFRKSISELAKAHFPKKEIYSLADQILRSSRSVTVNMAEGYGRFYYQDTIRFFRIARGSLEETLEHLIIAFDEKYISKEQLKTMKDKHNTCLKLINGYIRYLAKTKRGEEVQKK